jgi:hypothetical protein
MELVCQQCSALNGQYGSSATRQPADNPNQGGLDCEALRCGSRNQQGSTMSEIIYPLEILQRIEKRWAAQLARARNLCRSNPAGTDTCDCGHMVIAPCESTFSPFRVANKWHCTKCDRIWYTYADPTPDSEGAPQDAAQGA